MIAGESPVRPVLVVGTGFAGATIARTLAEAGIPVTIIDKRSHIGGNAYDYINPHGENVHKYGPHLLHGDQNSVAVRWLSRFTRWTPYEHRVRALLPDGRTTPLPINQATLRDSDGPHIDSEDKAAELLNTVRVSLGREPSNTDEFFLANAGERLSDLFFRPYTRKMWGTDPVNLMPSIGSRLPVRTNNDNRYFTDSFQALPADGYTSMFEAILNHRAITVKLNTEFAADMEEHYQHCFLSLPVDIYFGCKHGPLPYRSIIFHETRCLEAQVAPVINFTDSSKYTRKTQWDLLPNSTKSGDGYHTITSEEPCSMDLNPGEYYYPVQNSESLEILSKYKAEALPLEHITFCGRTGLFRYIDMIPAVSIHLQIAKNFLASR